MGKPVRAVAVIAVAGLALAACGGGSSSGSGGGGKTLIVSSDLPLQGASADASKAMNQAMQVYLDSIGDKVGNYSIKLQQYDDSTAAAGKWDSAKCSQNATAHVQNSQEVAVMGTYNSGCAQLEIPILNQDPKGPMLMVSHANTGPSLTKPGFDAGAPEKYYPTGKRNYARVATTDDIQGTADAAFAKETLATKKVYVLNDNETYGQGVANAFAKAATADGLTVIANEPWDAKATNYTATMQKIKASGADTVFLGGIFDNNGGQLVKDKVAVLGDNSKIKLLAPDGFTGYDELQKLPQGQGMYLSFAGLATDQLRARGGAPAKLLDAYKAKYGADPSTNYALYAVAALQVILQAIQQSDGTRKGITDAVFSGSGVTVPAATSVLGKEIKINVQTGDIEANDVTMELMKNNTETFLKLQQVAAS